MNNKTVSDKTDIVYFSRQDEDFCEPRSHRDQDPSLKSFDSDGEVVYYFGLPDPGQVFWLDEDEDNTYLMRFPKSINLFSKIYTKIPEIKNKEKLKVVISILLTFQNYLLSNRNILDNIGYLPPLTMNIADDNSILIEWIFKDFRIGLCIEQNDEDSSWYIVSKLDSDKEGEGSRSGFLDISELHEIIPNIMSYVISNI